MHHSLIGILSVKFDLIRILFVSSRVLQLVHPSRVLKLRVRGTKKDLMQETSSEEISIVLPGIIARFDGSNIQVKRWKKSSDVMGNC